MIVSVHRGLGHMCAVGSYWDAFMVSHTVILLSVGI